MGPLVKSWSFPGFPMFSPFKLSVVSLVFGAIRDSDLQPCLFVNQIFLLLAINAPWGIKASWAFHWNNSKNHRDPPALVTL
jgi:hypothetical protein